MNFNSSTKALLVLNIATIIAAVVLGWELSEIIWLYWAQSVIIGVFQFIKIRKLKNFSTDNFKMYGHSVKPTKETKNKVASFFLFHYGFFHFIYFIFLGTMYSVNFLFLTFASLPFLFNHWYSYVVNKKQDEARQQNIGKIVFAPYARIIPMHITIMIGAILFGNGSTFLLIVFMSLKTVMDVFGHAREHGVG